MFRVDDPRSDPRILHELTRKKMAEHAESDIAICFVDENDQRFLSIFGEKMSKGFLKFCKLI